VNLPSSHATLTESSLEAVLQAARHGFTSAKVKGHPDERRLEALAELLDASPLPLRIDFNETLTVARLVAWHGQLSPTAQQRIEFVEDPCPYRVEDWQALRAATGWTLAVDRAAPHASHGFEIFVFKPAVMPLEPVLRWVANGGEAVLVTSYMDHPLGQLYAAYQASQLAARHPQLRLMGGLATHTLFNDLPASLDLGNGPDLHLPSGTGLGLDDYLTTLPWEPLTQ
jgi:O-succinylbenzoate synthase